MSSTNIDYDKIIFRTLIKNDIIHISKDMPDSVEQIAKQYNRTINLYSRLFNLKESGNYFEESWFVVEPKFIEQEISDIKRDYIYGKE